MKHLILKLVFWLYRKDYHRPLNEVEVDTLLTKLALDEKLRELPAYLTQCANDAKTQYLYSNDPVFKGAIIAYITLREQIVGKIPKREKTLTPEEEIGIMRSRGY